LIVVWIVGITRFPQRVGGLVTGIGRIRVNLILFRLKTDLRSRAIPVANTFILFYPILSFRHNKYEILSSFAKFNTLFSHKIAETTFEDSYGSRKAGYFEKWFLDTGQNRLTVGRYYEIILLCHGHKMHRKSKKAEWRKR